MKRILVPCDFSPTAKQAYTFALEIAKKTDAEVFVLNVIDIPFTYEFSPEVPAYLDEKVLAKLEQTSRENFSRMKSEHSRQHDIGLTVTMGQVTLCILNFIEEHNIDLIVMGTNGATGLKEYFVGSNTEKIVRFSKVPVFVVRKAVNISSIKNIVLPTTLELNQVAFMGKVKELQSLFGAILWLLVVNRPGKSTKDARKELDDFVKHYKLTDATYKVRENEDVEEGIMNFTREVQGDMIAMGTHGRKGLAHLFSGSVTENVVNHVDCPIWTYTIAKQE